MAQVLSDFAIQKEPENLLVGLETNDDAAVYDLKDGRYLISTLDFFTPIVDDPYTFGQIAACNSLSDVYAMGGRPTMAMNIVCFPNCLEPQVLKDILRGGYDKMVEAGCLVVGGHTVQDDEPKYGLSVIGFCKPDELITNKGAKVGDIILMTKPIGTGIINTAIKGDLAKASDIEEAVATMSTLNAFGLDAIQKAGGANGLTDITGFGLGGHLIEMMEGADLSCELYGEEIAALQSATDFAKMGLVPKGAYDNKKYFRDKYESDFKDYMDDLIFNPETSGGLLISVDEKRGHKILENLQNAPFAPAYIGRVTEKKEKRIYVKERGLD